jgi:ABC-type oligopeptide transport system substrate-binding subunit/class 3 adenylate cyclase
LAERLRATRGQVSQERRTVTILFSDVKGSTSMASDMDPEEWTEIMEGAFELLITPVYRYEGTVARLMGDAILAFFGAPIAHEDDPERACRAALEITAQAQRYGAKLARERGIAGFDVRVGINTGLVLVGEVGSDLCVEYTAMGDAVNLAARMESAAEPGTILITEDTHKLIVPLFDTEPLGSIEVKGKTAPVPVYRVLAAKIVPYKPRGVAGLESPLVGRTAESEVLSEALQRLQAGVGGIVTIIGEAGIGKSRLVAEMRVSGALHFESTLHLRWVEGRCLSYGASISYLLWLDVLRGLLGVMAEDQPQDVRAALEEWVWALCPERFDEVYPYLCRTMSLPLDDAIEERLAHLNGVALKERTFRAVETLLACAARDRPLVLVCEDLHWSDPSSLALLEHLLDLTGQVPLLMICVFRPVRDHGSWLLCETIGRDYRHRHTDLWLRRLSAADSERLVGNLLCMEDLPAQLKARILDRAEGNPFYLEEVLRSLIHEGVIVQDEARRTWQTTLDIADIAIPDTLQGLLLARIDRLQEETKRVLQMAAVIGRIFLYRVLVTIAAAEADVEAQALDQRLGTLQREEMIRERARLPELEYIFKHELTREAAYNGLLKRERRVFHRRVAEALERLFPERAEEQVGLLAHHWERAGAAKKAVEYLQRAGDQARLVYAHDEAVDYYQRALRFLKEGEEHEQAARTLMKLGLTYHNAFQFRRAHQAYEEGFSLWQRASATEPTVLPPAPHALRLSWDPRTLDPAMAGDLHCIALTEQLFSGLVELSPEMDIVPDMARTWTVSEDGREYVFHLRNHVRWSDGVPVTAGDFEYAWKRVLDPATGSPFASLLYLVKGARAFHQGSSLDPGGVGVRALDSATLKVELEEPAGYFLHLLACTVTYPVPRHVVENHGGGWTEAENIATNGPFRLKTWKETESTVLERNPEFHGRFTGNVQRVELTSLEGWAARLELYDAGSLDMLHVWYFPPVEKDRARRRYAGEYVTVPQLGTIFLVFDVSRPPFSGFRVRRAFALATDRETLAHVAMGGFYRQATGGLVPAGMPGHAAGIGLPYDPRQARQLLAQAGYPGGHGFPPVDASTWPQLETPIKYLQTHWQENLGIEIIGEVLEWDIYLDRLKAQPPHVSIGVWVADYPDPHNFLGEGLWLPPQQGLAWRNKAYDGLLGRAKRIQDQGKRMRLYRQAEQILAEQAPIVPLLYTRWDMLVKPWVSRYPVSPRSCWFWKDVIIEPH